MLSNLKAVFFDLDDTLVFSETTHKSAWKTVLTDLGIAPSLIDSQLMVGSPDIIEASHFIKYFNLKETAESLVAKKRACFLKLAKEGLDCAAGRNFLLQRLSASHITAVVSASAKEVIQEVLHLEKISPFFNFVIGLEDCKKFKPDPYPYLHALTLANLKPHEALVIEDSATGITAALNASIPVWGLLKNQRPEQLIENVPYFHSFEEIEHKLFGSI